MKVKIKDKKVRFTLYFPLSFIKCKFIYKALIEKYTKAHEDKDEQPQHKISDDDIRKIANGIYKMLKQYKTEFGSFSLVDINTADGSIVKIVI